MVGTAAALSAFGGLLLDFGRWALGLAAGFSIAAAVLWATTRGHFGFALVLIIGFCSVGLLMRIGSPGFLRESFWPALGRVFQQFGTTLKHRVNLGTLKQQLQRRLEFQKRKPGKSRAQRARSAHHGELAMSPAQPLGPGSASNAAGAAPAAVFDVGLEANGWMIALSGRSFGPCASREEAIALAISTAEKARAKGCSAEVRMAVADAYVPIWQDGTPLMQLERLVAARTDISVPG